MGQTGSAIVRRTSSWVRSCVLGVFVAVIAFHVVLFPYVASIDEKRGQGCPCPLFYNFYLDAPRPKAVSFLFSARSAGPATAPSAAIPIDLASVCPAIYIPRAAATAERAYEAAIA